MEIEKTKPTLYSTFKIDIVKVCLVFWISNFVINKIYLAKKISSDFQANFSWMVLENYSSKHYAKHCFNYDQALILCWSWVLCFISAPLKLHLIVLAVAGCSSRASGRSPNLIYWLNLTFSFYVPYHTKLVIFSTIIYSCYYLRTNL